MLKLGVLLLSELTACDFLRYATLNLLELDEARNFPPTVEVLDMVSRSVSSRQRTIPQSCTCSQSMANPRAFRVTRTSCAFGTPIRS